MECPHCGKEIKIVGPHYGSALTDCINHRLIKYGYPERQDPTKYQAMIGIKKTIMVRLGYAMTKNYKLSEYDYELALIVMNEILPNKEEI